MQRSLSLIFAVLAVPAFAEPILVIPFFNQSPAANVDWIAESIAHTVQEALTSRGVLVLDRSERETVYRRLSLRTNAQLTRASIIKVAENLDASSIVYGEFELKPGGGPRGTLRVTATTLDMKRMRKGAELLESGPLEDLDAVQSRLAWRILRQFVPESTPPLQEFLRERPPIRLDAMENYTRGLLATSTEQKRRLFMQAARLDSRFSEPRYELGQLFREAKDYAQAAAWLQAVQPNAPRYLEATFLLGLCKFEVGDYAGAQAAFQIVARSVPLNEVFNNLGAAQSRRNLPQALENFQIALEGDSTDPDYHFNVGYALWKRGQFEAAAASFRAVLERDPSDEDAAFMLERAMDRSKAGAGEAALERVKLNYEERAYRQLKAAIDAAKGK